VPARRAAASDRRHSDCTHSQTWPRRATKDVRTPPDQPLAVKSAAIIEVARCGLVTQSRARSSASMSPASSKASAVAARSRSSVSRARASVTAFGWRRSTALIVATHEARSAPAKPRARAISSRVPRSPVPVYASGAMRPSPLTACRTRRPPR